ncbi:MAG: choice-of-anchor D domain-containing protein [Myxococcota bacterium]
MAHRHSLALLVAMAAAACSDDPLSKVYPHIQVDPDHLDFGVSFVAMDNKKMLAVTDTGEAPLEIKSTRIEPAGDIFSVVDVPSAVGSNQTLPMTINYVPRRAHDMDQATLIIVSNDPAKPELSVPLTGEGGAREIEVNPLDIDFGVVDEGTSPRRAIEISNVGKDVLTIAQVTWTSTSIDLGLVSSPVLAGVRIAPLTSTVVEAYYSPRDLGADSGRVTIASDDEDEPSVEVAVRGRGNLAPKAIAWGCEIGPNQIGCAGARERRTWSLGLRQRLGIEGRDSVDPEGGPIASYRWILERKPADSATAIFHSADDRNLRKKATGDMEVDVVGTYELRLVVTDDRGLQSFDLPESRVTVRPKDLEVLLRWDVPTDVDLHVVRPGGTVGDYGSGAVGTSTGSDVSSFNRGPNWGDLMSPDDDPRLDIDDVTGRGPEVTSLDAPASLGSYEVWAHYCDSRNVGIAANVTIEVYVRGVKVATVPDSGTGFALAPGEVWHGADIQWQPVGPSAMVMPGLTNRPVMNPGLCRSH